MCVSCVGGLKDRGESDKQSSDVEGRVERDVGSEDVLCWLEGAKRSIQTQTKL
jgi:hypothetical protein